jgi:hypothetical protein
MGHRTAFYYGNRSNLRCVLDPDNGLTYYISGKRSQEQACIIAPWRLASSGRGWQAAALAAVELGEGWMAACAARGR